MIYAIIVYSISIYFWGLNNYLKESKASIVLKVAYVAITFVLFQYYFNSFRTILWDFFRHGAEVFVVSGDSFLFSKNIDSLISILFFVVSLLVAGLALNIGVRAKSRKLLLITSPLIIVVTTLDFYMYSVIESDLAKDNRTFLVFLGFVTTVIAIINLFYNLKPVRKIFL